MRKLLLALLALALGAGPALARPPVWIVRDADSTLVLFGSVHLLPPGLDWRPPVLESALARADDIWFEAPMDQAGRSAATEAAQAHAYLPEGRRLSTLLSQTGRSRLAKAAETLGIPADDLDRLQPWYAELVISSALFDKVGAQGEDGVEQQLWAGANAAAARHAFETPAQQVGFFADAPLADQVASLEQTLRDMSGAEHDYQVLLRAWMAADLRTLDREALRPLRRASPRLYATLVKQRNARWADAIAARLQGSGRTVVVVGMGHLIGRDGLPALLRARGYAVEGPP